MGIIVLGGLVVLVSILFAPASIFLPALGLWIAVAGFAEQHRKQHDELMWALGKSEAAREQHKRGG